MQDPNRPTTKGGQVVLTVRTPQVSVVYGEVLRVSKWRAPSPLGGGLDVPEVNWYIDVVKRERANRRFSSGMKWYSHIRSGMGLMGRTMQGDISIFFHDIWFHELTL